MLTKPFVIVTYFINLVKKQIKQLNIMKKIILIFAVIFSTASLSAQDCKKSCEGKKDAFVLEDGLIKTTLFHDNGNVAQTGYYTEDNKLQGEWNSYDLYGNKTAIAKYNEGDKVGTWLFYQGENLKEVSYVDSRIAEVKTWKIEDTRVVSNRP